MLERVKALRYSSQHPLLSYRVRDTYAVPLFGCRVSGYHVNRKTKESIVLKRVAVARARECCAYAMLCEPCSA